MEHQQVSSVSAAAPFSKKFSYDRGHGGKHVYDGVFSGGGGAVKLGARVLDYREIFGGTAATASSIPILDVPQLNENSKVSSFGAQRADYAKIFGGFGDDDFGLLHEELFAIRKKVKSSINGTRPLAEARSRNAGSKHSNVSKEQRDSSPEAPFQSIDGVKLLNVSYNKSNPGNKNGTNGMTRVAQLHAVPGYTFLVDEITPSKMTEGGKPARSVLNDSHLNANVGKSVKEDTARRKAVSGPQPRIADTNSFRSPAEFQKKSSRNRSISNDMPFDAFEIGLGRRPPSCSPTNSSYNIGGTDISKNSKFGVSRNDASRGADLPASSDEEMDANSDAAASAAALRKAIEEAQMKIKIAKELMERKNEGFQNRAKTGFNKSWKAQKSKVKTEERLKRSNELVDREMREKEDTAKQEFTGVSEGNVSKASQLTPDFGDEKKSSFANNAAGETHSKESKSTRTDNRLEAEDWESTEEFFEAADHEELREMPSEFEQSENAEKMASYNHENKWSEKMTAEEKVKKPEECTEEVFNEDKVERELNSVVGAFQWNLYANFVKPSQVCHREENENKTRISNNHEETYQTPTVSDEWKDCETVLENLHQPEENVKLPVQELDENEDMKELKDAQDWVETEKKQREALDHKETDNRSDEVSIREENDRDLDQIYEKKQNVEGQQEERDRVECEMKQGGWNLEEYEEKLNDLHRGEISGEDGETEKNEKLEKLVDHEEILKKSDQMNGPEENAELPVQDLEENEDMKGLKDAQDWVETEKKQREALDHREMENRSDEVPIGEESDGGLNQIYEKKENMEGQRKEWDRVECERKQGGWNLEENEKLNDLHRIEILGEEGKTEESEKPEELTDDEEILKKSDQMNETENREEKAREGIETERIRSKSCPGEQDEKTMEVTEQALRYDGDNLEMAEDANEQYENENLGGSDNALGCKINFAVGDLKAEVLTTKENGRVMGVTESSPLLQGTEKESEAVEDANNLEQQNCEIAGLTQGFIGLDRIKKQTADVTEALLNGENGIYLGENDINFEDKQNEHHVTEYKNMSNQEKFFEEVTNEMDANGNVDICEPEVGTDNEESEKSSISSHNERWSSDETESLHDPVCCVEEAAHELGENNNDVKESEVATNHEKDKNSCESSDEDRWVGNDVDTEASQQPIFEGQGKTTEISLEEEPNQSTSKKEENHCKNPAIEEKEAEDNLQRKLEVEKKHFSEKEEVKVREIEREKERIAVERAIQEARERAFAEARERAAVKRAAAEAHQRLKAEVRERLGKALLEANNKLAAEKASFEAKLKAERAAVERATAEARQRALEKALSEKVRNQAEKSAAERFSSISKDNGMNSRDKQCNDPGPSSSSRYPGSSNHGERFNGGNGESAPRNKATLERHQRTAERAAKALAEKNMRELLAQKEQAERNRLAETLEADVKRWSSGKERNLRALLSTLPYILGPDSGWQPIPLTELVSSTAVKKAYRKATLFVHPDKLQQRGASIQLKYTCEKVFDLLKDAWNKFSAEER
ncbi:auxilin-like protein 1 isoform X3 [Populus alba x Populus x berolinensis]|nr:auxilin-like protein 1 isoform X3 [Populus alba x Populus x berolinensis]